MNISEVTVFDSEDLLSENVSDNNLFGVEIAMGKWEAMLTILILGCLITITVVGNILVILSVLTHNPLKILSNYYVVSLAVADLTVALTVLPLNVAYTVLGRWIFGSVMCKVWLTADVLCCTASILNLCAIALDRYKAVHDPINYATKRTKARVYFMIFLVWLVSCIICLPPLIGWNDWPDHFTPSTPCMLTEEKGYIVYSSLGSFFIPLILIVFLYFKIFTTQQKVASRRKQIKTNTGSQGQGAKQADIELQNGTTKRNQNESSVEEEGSSVEKPKKSKKGGGSKKKRKHILAVVKEKNSIMYQKSTKAGSQSGIDRLNGNGEVSQLKDTEKDISRKSEETQSVGENFQYKCRHHSTKVTVTTGDLTRKPNSGHHCDKSLMAEEDTSHSSSDPQIGEIDRDRLAQFRSKFKTQVSDQKRSNERRQKASGSREQKAARTMAVIVVTFVVCWLPFFTMYVTLPFCGTCSLNQMGLLFITWLGYLNSTLNPIIYTIFNPYFRKAFSNILSCKKL